MPEIRKELLDELIVSFGGPEALKGPDGLLKQLTAALMNRALEGELTDHVGYARHSRRGRNSGNSRNGHSAKKLLTDQGELAIEVPRDRNGTFEPQLVKKHQTRFEGFDDKIISMYARGMTVRDIQGHLKEMYGTEVSPELISTVTDEVMDEVKTWQSRPLDAVWPIVYLDALVVKVRHQGTVRNKALYLALGVNLEGHKEVLGMWIETEEGAKFWLKVVTELKNRGVEDILIACCDGLKGFPQALEAVFPKTLVQTCIVHLVRASVKYVSYKERRQVTGALKKVYQAATEQAAEYALDEFEVEWGDRYPLAVQCWRSAWERVIPFLSFPKEIRKALYTTNAIESMNYQVRKVTRNRGHFPNDEAVFKLVYLALRNASQKWTMPIQNWGQALQQFALHFEGRVPV